MDAGDLPARRRASGRPSSWLPSAQPGHRYGVLLGLIAASLGFQLAAPDADWARLVTVVFAGATVLLALWTSQVRALFLRGAAIVVAAALTGAAVAVATAGTAGSDSTIMLNLLLAGVAPMAVVSGIVRNLRQEGRVTLAATFGALCVYLLLGITFAFIYGVIDIVAQDGLFAQEDDPRQADFLYFSFATMTTTGYGDLTSNIGAGRACAMLEALLGQLYLVTVVAAIVGNLQARLARAT